ncbi:MAG TPA: hypothetical protein VK179_06310 [Bacteroidales bacterium]|nr:hypothetical protein [Bacteroidales bacterium]
MKSIALLICLLSLTLTLQAQSEKYRNAMSAMLQKAGTVQTLDETVAIANSFTRIAEAEKSEWTAWYYAAFYNLSANFKESDKEKKKLYIDQAQKMIETGLTLKPEETEFMVIKVMSYYATMAMDPMNAMPLLSEANELIRKAKTINPDNPRIYFIEAQAIYNMPVGFGGGKEKALPVLLVAKEKFDKFVPSDNLVPNWGREQCDSMVISAQTK